MKTAANGADGEAMSNQEKSNALSLLILMTVERRIESLY